MTEEIENPAGVPSGVQAKPLCAGIKPDGTRCKKLASKGTKFCWSHRFGDPKKMRWWETMGLVLGLLGIPATWYFAWYYAKAGATKEGQDQQITILAKTERILERSSAPDFQLPIAKAASFSIIVSNPSGVCWTSAGFDAITPFTNAFYPLSISITNTSDVALDRIIAEVTTTFDEAITFQNGWEREYPGKVKVSWSAEQNQANKAVSDLPMTHWITGTHPIASGDTFILPTIYFTNLLRNADGYNFFPIFIKAFSPGSKTYSGSMLLVSPRKGATVQVDANGMLLLN